MADSGVVKSEAGYFNEYRELCSYFPDFSQDFEGSCSLKVFYKRSL